MIHMKTKSAISKAVLVSKKDFETMKPTSALSIAEKMTEQFVGERKDADKVGSAVIPSNLQSWVISVASDYC